MKRAVLQFIVWLNRKSKSAAIRLTKITGKSSRPIHPKHLVTLDGEDAWYVPFVPSGSAVLDAGCANGIHTLRAAAKAGYTVGIDANSAQLQIARHLASVQPDTDVLFAQGDVGRTLPFLGAQFDVVLLLDVIEHLHQRIFLLTELARVLKPDGILLVSAPNRDTRWKRRLASAGLSPLTDPDHKVEYTYAELCAELSAGGFALSTKPMLTVYDTPWAGLIDVVGGISLPAYRRLAQWKVDRVAVHPSETTGWRLVCHKQPAAMPEGTPAG